MNRKISTIEKRIFFLFLFAVLCLQIKYIFMEFDADTAYALTTSWRMLMGDRMFVDMWEPHQTSSFLLTAIMWLYVTISGTNTGIVLFTNAMGILIHIAITFAVYRTFKKHVDPFLLSFMCFFLLIVRPKGYVLPDFSNMQLWFSILLFLCLFQYFHKNQRKIWLILSSVALCLQILSYPSCVIVYIGVCVILFLYSDHKWKDILLFSTCCFVQGCAYILYFVLRIGFHTFINSLSNVLSGDSAHSLTSLNDVFWLSLQQASIWLLVCLLLAVFVVGTIHMIQKGRGTTTPQPSFLYRTGTCFSLFVMVTSIINLVLFKDNQPYSWLWFTAFYICIFIFSGIGFPYCSAYEKKLLVMGYIISFSSFLAVLMLTNLDFLCSLNYIILALMLCFIPISRLVSQYTMQTDYWKKLGLLIMFCATVGIHNGLDILYIGGIVKSGPVMGWVSDYVSTYQINASVQEWEQYVQPGESVLIIGTSPLNPIAYMYEDINISMHSVMCDPTHNESLLEYWEAHPEKYPDIVIAKTWYGDLLFLEEDSWIMQWLKNEFQPDGYVDGCFWRYYR